MKKTYLLLHTAVLLAGLTGVFGKLISLNEGLLVWYRVLLSAIILFVIVRLFKVDLPKDAKSKWEIAKAGMLITTHWLFFYASIKYSNVSIGVVCFCLTSFFTAILKPLIDRTRFRPSELLLSALTLVGISLIFHFDSSYRLGIALGVISSMLATLYTIFSERLSKKYESVCITYYQMLGGAIGLTVLLPLYLHFFPSEHILPNFKDGLYLFVLALFCTVGLYLAITHVLKSVPAFTVNLSFNLEPIYSIILAFILFGEGKEVSQYFYIGLAFIITSVVMQTMLTVRRNLRSQKI